MSNKNHVVVAMSGGVDSSVAAALLLQQGFDVTGIMLRLWNEPGLDSQNRCCTTESLSVAREIAAQLGIPFYTLNAENIFKEKVVDRFLSDLTQGITPNPCISCNRYIRWDYLLKYSSTINADFLATGHYARLHHNSNSSTQLLQGVDLDKDQSYVLAMLTQEQLAKSIFPLGNLTKPHVRKLAEDLKLSVSSKPDSQDLCFITGKDYRQFYLKHAPEKIIPGEIKSIDGKVLGEHSGLALYTIGQRKGIGIPSSHPYYVIEKIIAENALIIGRKVDLGLNSLMTHKVNWISGSPPGTRFRAQIKIRYRSSKTWGEVSIDENNCATVRFDEPLDAITPGQAAVFYSNEICLGGGIIR